MSSARKLFVCIEVPAGFVHTTAQCLGMDAEAVNPLAAHVTVQYCGKLVTDDDLEMIKHIWTDELAKARLSPLYDADISTTGELYLFGDEKRDQLVALCATTPKFCKVVADARARVIAALPHIPASKHDFSPHITIGTMEELPENASVPPLSFRFDKLFLWGDKGAGDGKNEVRDEIAIPFDDV